tara:strand:- start:32 stop:547 length:516 start_codon:yes stop_codon:yes gene_type:complete
MTGQINVNKIAARTGNTITINSGDKISGAAGSIVAPGQVLQCVQYYAASPGAQSTSSTSFVATGIKKTITPKASGNLIIIQTHITMAYASASAYARIYLNGSAMAGSENYHMGYMNISHNSYAGMMTQAQHTTTNTSALEFEIYVRVGSSGTFTYTHDQSSTAMTLWEIAQ